jgi:hypothetical protein
MCKGVIFRAVELHLGTSGKLASRTQSPTNTLICIQPCRGEISVALGFVIEHRAGY